MKESDKKELLKKIEDLELRRSKLVAGLNSKGDEDD